MKENEDHTLQYKRTDRDITNAFLKLLEQKRFEKITVQDILNEAMINRSTFYVHYQDKYALAESLQEKTINEFKVLVDEIRKKQGRSFSSMDDIIEKYMTSNNGVLKKLLLIHGSGIDLREALTDQFTNYFYILYFSSNEERSNSQQKLEARMMSSMFVEFFLNYVNNNKQKNYSKEFFDCFYQIALYFFVFNDDPKKIDKLNEIIGFTKTE